MDRDGDGFECWKSNLDDNEDDDKSAVGESNEPLPLRCRDLIAPELAD